MGSIKRLIQIGAKSGIGLSKLGVINAGSTIGASAKSYRRLFSSSSGNHLDNRQISPNNKLVAAETIYLLRRLEAKGIAPKDAEAFLSALSEVVNETLETSRQVVDSNAETEKDDEILMVQREIESLQKATADIRAGRLGETKYGETKLRVGDFFTSRDGGLPLALKFMIWMIPVYVCWKPVFDRLYES